MKTDQRGFVALISTIIIMAVLLLVIASVGLVGSYSRFNMLDSELKERSIAAADACADEAILQFALDPGYSGGALVLNALDSCRSGKRDAGTSTIGFSVQATSSDHAVTNLRILLDKDDLSVISWQEVVSY